MQLKISILVLFSIIIISGCTSLPTGNGVVITEFYTDFDEILAGERADFYLKMKNLGSQEAENVFAELLGLDIAWYDTRDPGGGPWVGKEKLPNQPECRYTSGTYFTLLPPNPLYGTDGEEHVCTWSYFAPEVPSGMSMTYEPKIRLFYDYKTSADISVTLLPRNEMINLQNSGKTPPANIISKTSSPVDVSIKIKSPIRVSVDSVSFDMEVTLTNVGGGVPCLKERCKKKGSIDIAWDKITLNIIVGNSLSSNCESLEVPLYKGSNTLICKIDAKIDNLNIAQQKTIKLNLDYSYYVDKKITIEIVGN